MVQPKGDCKYHVSVQCHKTHCVTFAPGENAFIVHKPNGGHMFFQPSHQGLYYHNTRPDEQWTLITTVKGQADKYTKRMYEQSKQARKLQNIIMRPNTKDLTDIVLRHMPNCPVARSDIQAAEDIFGPNIGALKGKTVQWPNSHVTSSINGIPPDILKVHKSMTLVIDIFFIKKIAFFITLSRS